MFCFSHHRLAFERALSLDSHCTGAMSGLAILELNSKKVQRKVYLLDYYYNGTSKVVNPRSIHVVMTVCFGLLFFFTSLSLLRMMCYSVMTQAYSEKEIPSSPNRSRTYDLPITGDSWELRPLN